MRSGFTLIELLVVIAAIAVLAAIMAVQVGRTGNEARQVRTQALIDDFKQGVEKYVAGNHKYPFVAERDGTFNVDDCWRELSPLTPGLTAGRQPGDPGFRNKLKLHCIDLTPEQLGELGTPGDGKNHVVDSWGKPFCMQWDYLNKKTMIWSAGEDGLYEISDDPVAGGHSNLFCPQSSAKAGSWPVSAEAKEMRIERDQSNY